jgi:hypothetical protein
MTRQEGPFGVQPEPRGHEILAPLRLAGIEGRVKGVLDERSLLLERRDGKGLRIDVESIHRVRHHHMPITPPGITWIGVITLILAARVLSGPIQLYALAIGAITIFSWLIGRRPALCIDTKAGDRHIIHGRDSLLLRTQMMVNRLCDGKSMDEAREGLEELHRHSNYPAVTPLESIQAEAAIIAGQIIEDAQLLPEPDVFDEADLEQALKNMYRGEESQIPEPQPAETFVAPAATIIATESFATDTPADHAGRSLLDRARNSLHETRPEAVAQEVQPENLESWTQPWNRPAENPPAADASSAYERTWGRTEPDWYAERDQAGTRIQSALTEAKEEAGSFFSGSMFDAPEPSTTTETGIFGSMFDAPATVTPPMVAPLQEPVQPLMPVAAPVALATTLPEPTFHAVREECTPGIVAAARLEREAEQAVASQPVESRAQPNTSLTAFPALSAMAASQPSMRLRPRAHKESRLGRLAKRSISALFRTEAERPNRQMVRPVEVQDDYAATYGDEDGFADGNYRELPLRSGQIIRLRADQDHQAEVAERLRDLSRSSGGVIADDDTDALIERLSASGDLAPIASLLAAADDQSISFGTLASTSPPKQAPGHHGLSRLG